MNNVQFGAALIAFITNIIILITQLVQVYRLKNQIKGIRIIINNTTDLKLALNKPLEGMWEVRGQYKKYHNETAIHNCSGYVNFCWNDLYKRYDVYYVYSVRKENDVIDLVTAICSGIAICDENGNIEANKKLTLQMKIDNRCSIDKFNNSSKTFELISNKIVKKVGLIK